MRGVRTKVIDGAPPVLAEDYLDINGGYLGHLG
jgi:hypothetical protein